MTEYLREKKKKRINSKNIQIQSEYNRERIYPKDKLIIEQNKTKQNKKKTKRKKVEKKGKKRIVGRL